MNFSLYLAHQNHHKIYKNPEQNIYKNISHKIIKQLIKMQIKKEQTHTVEKSLNVAYVAHIYKYEYLMSKICWIETQREKLNVLLCPQVVKNKNKHKKENI